MKFQNKSEVLCKVLKEVCRKERGIISNQDEIIKQGITGSSLIGWKNGNIILTNHTKKIVILSSLISYHST